MCLQKRIKKSIILASFAILAIAAGFAGCDAVDSILSSTDTYKVNAQIGSVSLDECSYISAGDEITPFFEESVYKDPDITSLIVSIQDYQFVYSLRRETVQYKGSLTRTIKVSDMDDELPSFEIPDDLPEGLYQIVFQIMSGSDVLQKTEKDIYYLGDTDFTFDEIKLHLPGISENTQMVSKGQVVMLEAELDFDSNLDPYIIWYSGDTKLSEGKYSEDANILLWEAPQESNFYPIHAEVFPVKKYVPLAGYQKSISILVSSNAEDVNLIPESAPELLYWYLFDGNLNDSNSETPDEHTAIKPVFNNEAEWISSDGTYGLAAGANNVFMLPKVPVSAFDTLQLLFRLKPLDDGTIASVYFDSSSDNTVLELSVSENALVLTLSSSSKKVSRSFNLPDTKDSFHTIGINFTVRPRQILANINVLDEMIKQDELHPLSLDAAAVNDFQIILGFALEKEEEEEVPVPEYTVLWDEFALYLNPSMELIMAEVKLRSADLIPIYE